MVESDIRRALDEVAEFVRALAVAGDNCLDFLDCRNKVTDFVVEAAPLLVERNPILLELLAATSAYQITDFLMELAVRSKCPLAYLSPAEKHSLHQSGLSSREQLLLGRLRERLRNSPGTLP